MAFDRPLGLVDQGLYEDDEGIGRASLFPQPFLARLVSLRILYSRVIVEFPMRGEYVVGLLAFGHLCQ